MRWNTYQHLKFGTLKIVTGFLFLPKTIAGETRWLEKATWERKYVSSTLAGSAIWISTHWID